MKRKSLPLVLAAFVIGTLVLAGSAAADPPKEDFYCGWGHFIGWQDCEVRVTGAAAHCPGQGYTVQLANCSHPLVNGTIQFWYDTDNLVKPDGTEWYDQERFHGGWRIQPVGIDGYWEGTLTSNPGQFGLYEPLVTMQGKGYGELDGYLLKGTHWWEPDTSGMSPYGDFRPANGGVIIATGQVK